MKLQADFKGIIQTKEYARRRKYLYFPKNLNGWYPKDVYILNKSEVKPFVKINNGIVHTSGVQVIIFETNIILKGYKL